MRALLQGSAARDAVCSPLQAAQVRPDAQMLTPKQRSEPLTWSVCSITGTQLRQNYTNARGAVPPCLLEVLLECQRSTKHHERRGKSTSLASIQWVRSPCRDLTPEQVHAAGLAAC